MSSHQRLSTFLISAALVLTTFQAKADLKFCAQFLSITATNLDPGAMNDRIDAAVSDMMDIATVSEFSGKTKAGGTIRFIHLTPRTKNDIVAVSNELSDLVSQNDQLLRSHSVPVQEAMMSTDNPADLETASGEDVLARICTRVGCAVALVVGSYYGLHLVDHVMSDPSMPTWIRTPAPLALFGSAMGITLGSIGAFLRLNLPLQHAMARATVSQNYSLYDKLKAYKTIKKIVRRLQKVPANQNVVIFFTSPFGQTNPLANIMERAIGDRVSLEGVMEDLKFK